MSTIAIEQKGTARAGAGRTRMTELLPLWLGIFGAVIITLLRWQNVWLPVTNDWAMTVFALITYISAGVLMGTYLFWRDPKIARLGAWIIGLALCFNIAAWTGRYIRFEYYPLNDLYDVALWFSMLGAGISLFVSERMNHRYVLALIAPLVVLALTTALLMGGEAPNLPPALRSYWRPIHVSFAVTGYAVCGVAFCVALLHLLKEGVRLASMGVFVAAFGVLVYLVVSDGAILTDGLYGIGVQYVTPAGSQVLEASERVQGRAPELLRAIIPGLGGLMRVVLLSLASALVIYGVAYWRNNERLGRLGHTVIRVSLALQAIGLIWLFAGARRLTDIAGNIAPWQTDQINVARLQEVTANLVVSPRSNPIEVSGLFTILLMTAFVGLMSFKTEKIRQFLPSSQRLDDLTYRLVSVAFPLLTLLLITGAVWANESWGRYWSWDPKENAALVTWLIYGMYIHVRVMRGWTGTRSAYFAVLGFIAVIFAFIGISFLPLNSLHSYIQ